MKHSDRKHSKFSASGSERWFNCSGSVALSEGIPSKETPAGVEGTRAHEVLEMLLGGKILKANFVYTLKMIEDGLRTVDFLNGLCREHPEAEFMVETRIYLDFIHPEMFGTFDSGIVELFGTLHVIDYKYGKYMVNPKNNLQMLFYAIGLAHKYHWNFKKVRM